MVGMLLAGRLLTQSLIFDPASLRGSHQWRPGSRSTSCWELDQTGSSTPNLVCTWWFTNPSQNQPALRCWVYVYVSSMFVKGGDRFLAAKVLRWTPVWNDWCSKASGTTSSWDSGEETVIGCTQVRCMVSVYRFLPWFEKHLISINIVGLTWFAGACHHQGLRSDPAKWCKLDIKPRTTSQSFELEMKSKCGWYFLDGKFCVNQYSC